MENHQGPFAGPFEGLNVLLEKNLKDTERVKLCLRQLERKIAIGTIQDGKIDEVMKNKRLLFDTLDAKHAWIKSAMDILEAFLEGVGKQGLSYSANSIESLKELRRQILVDMEKLCK